MKKGTQKLPSNVGINFVQFINFESKTYSEIVK